MNWLGFEGQEVKVKVVTKLDMKTSGPHVS